MQPHQQRVVEEQAELEGRRRKLIEFIQANPLFKSLDETNQALMKEQFEAMTWLDTILRKRIELF